MLVCPGDIAAPETWNVRYSTNSMDKYRRVVDPERDSSILPEDTSTIRVNVSGKLANYVSFAEGTLSDANKGRVELVAIGRAINRAVTVAEILRRNIDGLHQEVSVRSIPIRDKYVPLEEGLDPIETERTSSCISIVLSKSASWVNTSAPGYAPPSSSKNGTIVSEETIAEMDQERSTSGVHRGKANNGSGSGVRGRRSANNRGRGGRGRGRNRGDTADGNTNDTCNGDNIVTHTEVIAPSVL